MSDATVVPSTSRKRGWLKILGGILGGLVLLLIIAYFVVTSSAFFTGFVLPKVNQALHAQVTVADASISPFSQVILKQVNVQTTGTEPLFKADEVRLVYHLGAILGGNYQVDEITVASPVINIVINADGTSNLDPLTQGDKSKSAAAKPASTSKSSIPPKIDIKKIALSNATISLAQSLKDGARNATKLSNINVTIENLKNGQTGKLTLGANILVDDRGPAPGASSVLQAVVAGSFSLALSQDLKPASVNGNTHVEVQKAEGALSQVAGLSVNLDCDISPTNIKQVALSFQKGGSGLGQIRVSGPFDMEKTEGQLDVEIAAIDKQLLNLAGAASGIDFGATTISATNHIDLSQAGNLAKVAGQLNIASMTVTRQDLTTPMLNLGAAYNVTINRTDSTALLQTLSLDGTQNRQPLLRAELTSPMTLAWGAGGGTASKAALRLSVTNMNLADWKSVIGSQVSQGVLNVTADVESAQGGQNLAFNVTTTLAGLTAQFGGNQISQAGVRLQTRGEIAAMDKVNLTDLHLDLSRQNQPLLSVAASGTAEVKAKAADLQLTINATLPGLFQVVARPGLSASSGTLDLKGHVVSKGKDQTLTGKFQLADFTGKFEPYVFASYGLTADLDVAASNGELKINQAAGSLTAGKSPGGNFEVTGNFDQNKKAGQFTLKLANLNQDGLRPFLTPSLGGKQLVSVALNATASAQVDPQASSSVKGNFQLANLVVSDPASTAPTSPLEAKLDLDASLNKQVAEMKQCKLTLTPTTRAQNELNFTGTVDLSKPDAIQGSLKLAAQSLDVTHYYDIMENKSKTAAPAKSAASPAPAGAANAEPPAMHLPLHNFSVDATIGQFFIRDVAITNWQISVKIDDNRVIISPCQLTLNGAPVNANINANVGVPGYQYDISFSATRVPIAPFVDSFIPSYKGKAKGDLIANVQIKGAGTTGVNLKKTLTGQSSIAFTNANIQVTANYAKILSVLSAVLPIPDLSQSPIQWLASETKIANGTIDLTTFKGATPAVIASSHGTITIADVFTNSTIDKLPLDIAAPLAEAQKAGLAPANANTNNPYVDLGVIVTVGGTIGKPDPKIDYVAIGMLTARAGGGLIGGKTGQVLKGVEGLGGLLNGHPASPATTNQQPATAPAAKPNSLGGFLNQLLPPSK